MKVQYPFISVLFIPTNCTSKLQLADVILQRPLKCGFTMHFKRWSASCIKEQIESGTRHIELDLNIGTLQEKLCTWLFEAWKTIGFQTTMIIKGWQKCGLLQAFERDFQVQAMEANTSSLLFGASSNVDYE